MNANGFLMSLIVVGLAALGSYGQEMRAEQPAEIATAAEQPIEASGKASEKMREANKATGGLLDEENAERGDGVMAVDNALSWTMRYP
ncbi:MAG: hypothetical protein ACREXW_02080 [Gammaproteobacteria bacterium]